MTDKHVTFFALKSACEESGCPVCTVIRERCEKYIDNMLFEHVSDRGFRAKYRAAGGFCARHSRNLDSFRDGLAVAILGADILERFMGEFKKKKIRKPEGICPACEEQSRIETEFLTFLAQEDDSSQTNEEVRQFFTSSDGLCVPHYAMAIQRVKKIPRWLADFQENKYASLYERTRNFIEFSAWGRQKDFEKLSAEDKIVWKEIARVLRGNC